MGQIDGIDQWKSLIETSKRMRSIILINIDEKRGEEALILDQWKVVKSKKFYLSNQNSGVAYVTAAVIIETVILKRKTLF